jgi:hypothetical protein
MKYLSNILIMVVIIVVDWIFNLCHCWSSILLCIWDSCIVGYWNSNLESIDKYDVDTHHKYLLPYL